MVAEERVCNSGWCWEIVQRKGQRSHSMYDPLECVIVEDKLVKNVLYKVLRVGFHKVYLKKKVFIS